MPGILSCEVCDVGCQPLGRCDGTLDKNHIYVTMQMHTSCPCVRMKASVLKDCLYLAYFTLMVTRHIISFNNYIHSLILCSKRRKLLRNDNVTFRSIYFTHFYINLHILKRFLKQTYSYNPL